MVILRLALRVNIESALTRQVNQSIVGKLTIPPLHSIRAVYGLARQFHLS